MMVSAQAVPTSGGEAFGVSISPQYPAPYGQATLSIVSSSIDLASATMVVSIANKELYRGNAQTIAIPLGKGGEVIGVKVTVISARTSSTRTFSIQPQDVVLVAEPLSSAPLLYPGKPLVPIDGSVRVVAMANLRDANGKVSNPLTNSYSWSVDGMQIMNASGIGKESVIVASPLQYRSRSVSVVVSSSDSGLVGGADLSLVASEPLVRIYENDPLLGIIFERALSGNYSINGTEDTLYAAPFYMPLTKGTPLIQWFLNGNPAQSGNSITLRPSGSGKGSASLSLVASAGGSARATMKLPVLFGKASGGFSLFGL